MKILHLCLASTYNDNWGYQDNLLPKYHNKAGNNVMVITTNTKQENGKIVKVPEADYLLDDGIRVIRLDYKEIGITPFKKLRKEYPVYKYICDFEPDVIFGHGLISYSFYQAIKYKKKENPECRLFQDSHMDYYNGSNAASFKEKVFRTYYRNMNRRTQKYVDKVFGVTPWRVQYAEDYYRIAPEKTKLLVMGADDEEIHLDEKEPINKKIREKYNIPNDNFLIVAGGRIDRTKNIHLLMQAVSELHNERVSLLVFGKPNYEMADEMKKYEDCSNIVMAGWMESSKVYDLFLAADLIAFPGTHSVMWEQAVACRKPCIFKDWEGMHHVDIGGNCVFLKDDSADEMKNILNRILSTPDEYKTMLKAAQSDKAGEFMYSKIALRAIGMD